uniref:Uncharacterized protein n=1 Tax=Aegilops tauschii subsp. strangulata TaxID=200361 RepID=A0A453RZG2_AEGTS
RRSRGTKSGSGGLAMWEVKNAPQTLLAKCCLHCMRNPLSFFSPCIIPFLSSF